MALLPAILGAAVVIHIAGASVPLAAFGGLPKVAVDLIEHKSAGKTIEDVMPVIEDISDAFLPGAGIAAAVLFFLITHSKQPTPEDQQRMWEQAQGAYR